MRSLPDGRDRSEPTIMPRNASAKDEAPASSGLSGLAFGKALAEAQQPFLREATALPADERPVGLAFITTRFTTRKVIGPIAPSTSAA